MTNTKWKRDQGPKSMFESVTTILINDTDLKGLVRFTVSNPNIRRAYQPSGKWDTLIIYYLQPETVMENFSPNIREVPMIVMLFNRANDLELSDMAERIIQLLHEANLSKAGYVHVYSCLYTGELGSTYYDDKEKAYVKTLRFMIRFRKEEEGHG